MVLLGFVASVFFIPTILRCVFIERNRFYLTVVLIPESVVLIVISIFLFSLCSSFELIAVVLGYIISTVLGIIEVIKKNK